MRKINLTDVKIVKKNWSKLQRYTKKNTNDVNKHL